MRILMTAGATCEPIDSVRFITNFSTGQTGATLAEALNASGAKITYLKGKAAVAPRLYESEVVGFTSFLDLDHKMTRKLSAELFDVVIHLAAVSDYSVAAVEVKGQWLSLSEVSSIGKLSSSEDLSIKLTKNHKILNRIKEYVPGEKKPKVVGFKLTDTSNAEHRLEAVQSLLGTGSVDYVVHNDLSEVRKNEQHLFRIYRPGGFIAQAASAKELAHKLSFELNTER